MTDIRDVCNSDLLEIPEGIFNRVLLSQGSFFNKLTNIDGAKITADLLDPVKAICQAEVLEEFTSLQNKKLLEIGSGLGTNLAVWIKKYAVDGYGIEPSGAGFDCSFEISRDLLKANKINPDRIISSCGEALPFKNDSFDIVYSSNVLEHTSIPEDVVHEGIRVLKPGGILQFVYPNYHSLFDGHYAIFHPPVISRWFFPLYIKFIFRRDNTFAKTLRTQLNVWWTSNVLKKLKKDYPHQVLSLGEQLFQRRMTNLDFNDWAGLYRVKHLVRLAKSLHIDKLFSQCMRNFKMWTPIILTLKKL